MSHEITQEQAHQLARQLDRLEPWSNKSGVSHEASSLIMKQLVVLARVGRSPHRIYPDCIITTASQSFVSSKARITQLAFTRDTYDPETHAFTYAVTARKSELVVSGLQAVTELALDSIPELLPGTEADVSERDATRLLHRLSHLEERDMETHGGYQL